MRRCRHDVYGFARRDAMPINNAYAILRAMPLTLLVPRR